MLVGERMARRRRKGRREETVGDCVTRRVEDSDEGRRRRVGTRAFGSEGGGRSGKCGVMMSRGVVGGRRE